MRLLNRSAPLGNQGCSERPIPERQLPAYSLSRLSRSSQGRHILRPEAQHIRSPPPRGCPRVFAIPQPHNAVGASLEAKTTPSAEKSQAESLKVDASLPTLNVLNDDLGGPVYPGVELSVVDQLVRDFIRNGPGAKAT